MNYTNQLVRFGIIISIGLVQVACQSTPPVTERPATTEQAQPTGDTDIIRKTSTSRPRKKIAIPDDRTLSSSTDDERLREAALLFESGNPGLSLDMLSSVADESLTTDQQTVKRIMQAYILLNAEGSRQALRVLGGIKDIQSPQTLSRYLYIKARAYLMQGNNAGALYALLKRDEIISGRDRLANQKLIWDILEFSSDEQLAKLRQLDSSAVLNGWIELAELVKNNILDRAEAVNNWRIRNTSHPAAPRLLEQIATAKMDAPGNIAFILPISSPYKAAAEAILDGFRAMNSDQSMGNRYTLRIYDYGREPTNAPLYYRQATIEGADMVIGPLGRQSVESLMTQPELTTPTVILSPPGDEMATIKNLYQFSLSQELEAEHVAQRAWLDGHRRAAILYPGTAIGERMAIAFANRFVGLGGEVISDERYQPGNTDFSASVRKLLDIESSEQRIAAMKSLLGEKIVSETRRRQDIDLIFLPATNKNARLIKPVLDFFYAFDLPVYSTSRIFPGHLDTVGDIDLEGIRFPDMPWMIATNVEIESLRTFLQGAWPNRETSYNRLYALGMDLHSIIPLIDGFSRNPLLHYRGLSGILNMDENGIIDRQLLWAKFRRGTPRLMDRVSNYQGRYNEKKFRQGSATPPGNRN